MSEGDRRQVRLPNGHWSMSPALLNWVDDQRRAGISDEEIVSQLKRLADLIAGYPDKAAA